jgi:hypothetical protein
MKKKSIPSGFLFVFGRMAWGKIQFYFRFFFFHYFSARVCLEKKAREQMNLIPPFARHRSAGGNT